MSDMFIAKKCPECGKRFLVTTRDWIYKIDGKYFCSWTCFRQRQKKQEEQKKRRAEVSKRKRYVNADISKPLN